MTTQHLTTLSLRRLAGLTLGLSAIINSASATVTLEGNYTPDEPFWSNGGDGATVGIVGDTSDGGLTIDGGSSVTLQNLFLGQNSGVNGDLTLDGGSLTLVKDTEDPEPTGVLYAGFAGSSSVLVTNGATLTAYGLNVSEEAGSVASFTLSGSGTTFNNTFAFQAGKGGVGTITLTDGATMTNTGLTNSNLGIYQGTTGTLTIEDGASLTQTRDLIVGFYGTGYLNVTSGASHSMRRLNVGLYDDAYDPETGLGGTSEGYVAVSGAATDLTATTLRLGYESYGEMHVRDGATVTLTAESYIARYEGSSGKLTIDNATVNAQDDFFVGVEGDGELIIQNGGVLTTTLGFAMAYDSSTSSTTVKGAGSRLDAGTTLAVGFDNLLVDSYATLNILDYGVVNVGTEGRTTASDTVNIMVDGEGMLNTGLDDGTSGFVNDGSIFVIAHALLEAGTYTPITTGTDGITGSGTITGIGGTWDSENSQFVASAITTDGTGDLSGRRVSYFDGDLVVGFSENAGEIGFTPGELGLTDIDGRQVLGAYSFTTTLAELTVLSFYVGLTDYPESIAIWYRDGGEWMAYETELAFYRDGTFSFVVDSFSDYAITVPEPHEYALLLGGLCLLTRVLVRRRQLKVSRAVDAFA